MIETMPIVDPNGLYSIKKTRELLEISYSTIHRSAKKGILKLSHHQAFGKPLVKGSDIIAFWKSIY